MYKMENSIPDIFAEQEEEILDDLGFDLKGIELKVKYWLNNEITVRKFIDEVYRQTYYVAYIDDEDEFQTHKFHNLILYIFTDERIEKIVKDEPIRILDFDKRLHIDKKLKEEYDYLFNADDLGLI